MNCYVVFVVYLTIHTYTHGIQNIFDQFKRKIYCYELNQKLLACALETSIKFSENLRLQRRL